MKKILLAMPVLMILIPISANAETYTFSLSEGETIEKEFWFPSGAIDYSIHVSGGDERIIVELLDPKFNSLADGWVTQSHSNTIFTDSYTAKFANIGPRHSSSEGIHTFTFINPNSGDRTVKLRLDINEYNNQELEQERENELYCGPGTHEEDGRCVSNKQGGCLIATATYGSELAPQVQMLREIRDNSLLQTQSGQVFMQSFNEFYYSFSPTIADFERENPVFREAVKIGITPLITSLSILNFVDMDSEAEVLGYGIGLILLNLGMYMAAPVGLGLILVRRR